GSPERAPLVNAIDRELDELLRHADAAAREPEASAVQDFHRDLEPATVLAEQVRVRHVDVVEEDLGGRAPADAELVLVRSVLNAPLALDDERADARLGPFVGG